VCSTRPIRTVGPEPLHPHVCGPHVALEVHRRESCLDTVQIKPVSLQGSPVFCAFCISATTLPLPLFRLTSLGCAQLQRRSSSSWRGVCVLWATTFKFCRQQRDFTAGSSLKFSWVGSRPPPPSLSPALTFLVLAACR
jgi:hypothetical protein